ncbi:MAG: ATP-binding protein [Pseudomonadota bacterium]
MRHKLLLLEDASSTAVADTLHAHLNDMTDYEVSRRSHASDDIGIDQSGDPWDGVLLATVSIESWLPHRLSALVNTMSPATVIVATAQPEVVMDDVLKSGADDAFDPSQLRPASIGRLLHRSIVRRFQRVHVSTARHQYEELYNNMPVATLTVDADGAVSRANRALLKFLSVERAEQVSDHHLHGLLAGLAQLQSLRAGSIPEYRDSHIVTDDHGNQRHVAVFARAHPADGVAAMDVYLTDVTEQEQQARRAMEAENYRREIYDSSPTMMVSLNLDMEIVDCNRIFFGTLGRSSDKVIGHKLVEFLGEDTDTKAFTKSTAKIERGAVVRDMPVTLHTNEGNVMECAYSASPHVDANGMVVGMIAMLADVSERNRAQRERDELHAQLQLNQKLESIGELSAGIAHEINTPAQYVSDNLSFLQESFADVDGVFAALDPLLQAISESGDLVAPSEAIRKAIDEADLEYLREEIPGALDQGKAGIGKIREIVLALKDFSHPGSGTPEPSDINRLVESTVTVARNEYKYVADVSLELDPGLGPVSCMPSALGQVVLNIVVNAAHAIAEQSDRDGRGEITVRTQSLDEDHVEISISDNGPGVPEKIQSKIFDPFFTTKEVGRGTGQGLAISRRVVTEQHSGRLLLESEPGEGATFRIVLPRKSSHSSDALGAVA